MATLRFFHDFASPFSYLASTQVEQLSREENAVLHWHPMLLGAIFKEHGGPMVPLHTFSQAKRAYYGRDLDRCARFHGVPFQFPSRFPMNTITGLRLVLAAEQLVSGERAVALTHRIYRAYWVEDRDIASTDELASLAADVDLEPAELIAATREPAIKQALFDRTGAALAAGVFGAPSFLIEESKELVWGQDRLPLVRWLLAEAGGRPRAERTP